MFKKFMIFLRWQSQKFIKSGEHVTRYYMNSHLGSVLGGVDRSGLGARVLSISGSLDLCDLLRIESPEITEADFPQHNILNLPFPDSSFDYVACGQVLEHVEGDPQKAVDEAYRVLKPGGIAVFTSCLIKQIHDAPGDFWRFSPHGLRFLFKRFSDIIEAGGWGNSFIILMTWLGFDSWPIPHAKWHPLHKIAMKNDKQWPVSTWIVARK